MTFSSVSNTGLPKTNISQQKNADTDRVDKRKDSLLSANNPSENRIDDDVTLNQVERTFSPAREIDAKQAEELLPETIKSILSNSKTAISIQANTSAQTAQEILSLN